MPESMDANGEKPLEVNAIAGNGDPLEDLELEPETSANVVGGLNPQPFPPLES